jgi:putative AdoMet-dependent methyltransferase
MIKARGTDTGSHPHQLNIFRLADRPGRRYEKMRPYGANDNGVLCARAYDERYQAFADYERQAEEVLGFLGADAQRTSVDVGRGTGAYALHAARYYRNIHAGHILRAMLDCAHPKTGKARLTNIALDRGGFLHCDHNPKEKSVDAIVSVAVLHHAADFWKLVGLRRLASMLKPDGRFYLLDVVLSFDIARYESHLRQFVESLSRPAQSQASPRDEYRISRPIIEGLFKRVGLQREAADVADEFLAVYSCARPVTRKSAVGLDV